MSFFIERHHSWQVASYYITKDQISKVIMKLREHPRYGCTHLYVQYAGNRCRVRGEHQADAKKQKRRKRKRREQMRGRRGNQEQGALLFLLS